MKQIVKPIQKGETYQTPLKMDADGFNGKYTLIKCENGEEWTNLPSFAEIEGVIHKKDFWNSNKRYCYYLPLSPVTETVESTN